MSSVDWHGKPPDAHRYECRDCKTAMTTSNLTFGLAEAWRAQHAGHDTTETHEVAHYEPCTGPAETYCPNCGDCTCPVDIGADGTVEVCFDDLRADPHCPLHGLIAAHG